MAWTAFVKKTNDWGSLKIDLQNKIKLHINLGTTQLKAEAENFTKFIKRPMIIQIKLHS